MSLFLTKYWVQWPYTLESSKKQGLGSDKNCLEDRSCQPLRGRISGPPARRETMSRSPPSSHPFTTERNLKSGLNIFGDDTPHVVASEENLLPPNISEVRGNASDAHLIAASSRSQGQ
ncbi:hypothetical protein C8J57DRAFT_1246657 [Mycena rebaudengoi]|nr:hypothetical protein C8J57DRAFT_1246657 [Mycena rebaudengoi]